MTGYQKSILLLLLAATTAVGICEHQQAAQMRGQLLAQRQQKESLMAQIQKLTHDYQDAINRLAALRADTQRLNQNTLDLLRLRSEVTRLRPFLADVTALQKLLTQSAPGVAEWKPGQLMNVGRATPQHALQTFLWSSLITNKTELDRSFVADQADPPPEKAYREFVDGPENLFPQTAFEFRVLSQRLNSPTEAVVELYAKFEGTEGQGYSAPVTLRNDNGEWKLVLFNQHDGAGNLMGAGLRR